MIIYVAGYQEVIDPIKSYKVWDKRVNPIAPVVTKLSGAEIIGLFKQKKRLLSTGKPTTRSLISILYLFSNN